jgi:AmmeMemoRadiSam system protein A
MIFSPAGEQAMLELAARTIHAALTNEQATAAAPVPTAETIDGEELRQRAGAFVSLHRQITRRLRGCVGSMDATQPAARSVYLAARSVLRDPRFREAPVTLDELPQLDVEITLISPLQPLASLDEFDPVNDGIHLTIGDRHGCFLPQVARETGWNCEQLLQRLCIEKLGVDRDAWRCESAVLHKFAAVVIGPGLLIVDR